MLIYRMVSAAPKSGHEFQYYLALKHRDTASRIVNRLRQKWWVALWYPSCLRRADALWVDAMRRYHLHGQDVIETIGPGGKRHYQ